MTKNKPVFSLMVKTPDGIKMKHYKCDSTKRRWRNYYLELGYKVQ